MLFDCCSYCCSYCCSNESLSLSPEYRSIISAQERAVKHAEILSIVADQATVQRQGEGVRGGPLEGPHWSATRHLRKGLRSRAAQVLSRLTRVRRAALDQVVVGRQAWDEEKLEQLVLMADGAATSAPLRAPATGQVSTSGMKQGHSSTTG